jgi:hypothetical protein
MDSGTYPGKTPKQLVWGQQAIRQGQLDRTSSRYCLYQRALALSRGSQLHRHRLQGATIPFLASVFMPRHSRFSIIDL